MYIYCWGGDVVLVQGMQRPLIRRRHTVFPNRQLKQLSDHDFDEDQIVTVDLQARPGLDRSRKTQSFRRPVLATSHSIHRDFMADDILTSPTSPIAGTFMRNEIIHLVAKT